VNAHSLVVPQNYALVISGQFSGFNYNETTANVSPVIGVCVRVLIASKAWIHITHISNRLTKHDKI